LLNPDIIVKNRKRNQNISLKISSTILKIAAVMENNLRKKNSFNHIMQIATALIHTKVVGSTLHQSTITVVSIIEKLATSM